ncbi:hypothetical protein CAP48_02090 [Advenella sp. S44]|nr:hypothetical protein CAP48_02090 [Advenella sp. S44]
MSNLAGNPPHWISNEMPEATALKIDKAYTAVRLNNHVTCWQRMAGNATKQQIFNQYTKLSKELIRDMICK